MVNDIAQKIYHPYHRYGRRLGGTRHCGDVGGGGYRTFPVSGVIGRSPKLDIAQKPSSLSLISDNPYVKDSIIQI